MTVKLFFYIQSVFVAALAILLFWFYGAKAGYSAALGGLVCVLSNALFAVFLFKRHGAHAAKQIVRNFYRGEAIKLIATVIFFVLIFKFIPVNFATFFIGFIAGQLVFWVALLITRPRSTL